MFYQTKATYVGFETHSSGYEEFYLLGYNAVQSAESQQMFWRNRSPPSLGSKKKPSKKPQ
jgi:hypothetical protein